VAYSGARGTGYACFSHSTTKLRPSAALSGSFSVRSDGEPVGEASDNGDSAHDAASEGECSRISMPQGLTRNFNDLSRVGWNSEEGNREGATESEATTESGGSREETSEQ